MLLMCTINTFTEHLEFDRIAMDIRGLDLTGSMVGAGASPYLFQERSSSALITTLTLLRAIAAPAAMGFNRPNAAKGIPTTWYANAQNRF
jgi:hypothetical protein